jgi:hypothetical protein
MELTFSGGGGSTGVWTQGFALGWGRYSPAWATPLALFALVILEIGSCFCPGNSPVLGFLLSLGWQEHATKSSIFYTEMGISQTFCPSWPELCSSHLSRPNS